MFFKFRRMRAMDPLQVAMTGVRMGERYLQIIASDATLTGGLAQKTGLSGQATLAATDERDAERARKAANKAGVLIEVHVMSKPGELPWTEESFDMVVIDNTGGVFSAFDDASRSALVTAARGVLRAGGRVELIERDRTPQGESETALRGAGFKPVRTLAEKGGFRFIEGLKG
jgi:hypothetical protein